MANIGAGSGGGSGSSVGGPRMSGHGPNPVGNPSLFEGRGALKIN